jgi:hypothetical protein
MREIRLNISIISWPGRLSAAVAVAVAVATVAVAHHRHHHHHTMPTSLAMVAILSQFLPPPPDPTEGPRDPR